MLDLSHSYLCNNFSTSLRVLAKHRIPPRSDRLRPSYHILRTSSFEKARERFRITLDFAFSVTCRMNRAYLSPATTRDLLKGHKGGFHSSRYSRCPPSRIAITEITLRDSAKCDALLDPTERGRKYRYIQGRKSVRDVEKHETSTCN